MRSETWEAWVRETLCGTILARPSPDALRRAVALGRRLPGPAASTAEWRVRLIFDSATEPLPAGVRGHAVAERRLLYRVEPSAGEPRQLDLRVRRESSESLSVTGQLLPPPLGARVEARAGRVRRARGLEASGEFLLRGLPARAREMRLEVHGGDVPPLLVVDVPLLLDRDGGDSA